MTEVLELSASEVSSVALHAAVVDAFSDYIISFNIPYEMWPHLVSRQNFDMDNSIVLVEDEEVLAFCFASHVRPHQNGLRLATLGVVQKARRHGYAARLLDRFIERAAKRNLDFVEMECFAQNDKAMRLYESRGFLSVSPLYGYEANPLDGENSQPFCAPEVLDKATAFSVLDEHPSNSDLPLQVLPVVLQSFITPLNYWKLQNAFLAFAVDENTSQLRIACLVDSSASQEDAELLIKELRRQYPSYKCSVPQIQREDIGGKALENAGFSRTELYQKFLRRSLQLP